MLHDPRNISKNMFLTAAIIEDNLSTRSQRKATERTANHLVAILTSGNPRDSAGFLDYKRK